MNNHIIATNHFFNKTVYWQGKNWTIDLSKAKKYSQEKANKQHKKLLEITMHNMFLWVCEAQITQSKQEENEMKIQKIHKNVKSNSSMLKNEVSNLSRMAINKKFNTAHADKSLGEKMFKKAIAILKQYGYEINFNKEEDFYMITKEGNVRNYFN